MSKDKNALAEDLKRSPEGSSKEIHIRPFTSRLSAELTSEFETRNGTGSWCGYAMLDTVPEALTCCIETPVEDRGNPLCTVMFLKGSDEQNYLFQSGDHGFILLGRDLRILHNGPSLSDALDMVQIQRYRN
ncbi:MAG: hypothetical protein V7723_16760 [Sneathiella sp.]|uniref:hypothetical protein n=1 Tax=Sneathiella sp. TaxID=1964365 RepID=UPI0030032EF4